MAAAAVTNLIEHLKTRGGLQSKDLANIVRVSPATVSRWANGTASPTIDTQTVMVDLRYVVDRLADLYTPDETRLWLNSRHPLLHNERAIDLIYADRTKEVLAVIERLEADVYI
jgi:transcriptional regulator with XRE-family HTH domain